MHQIDKPSPVLDQHLGPRGDSNGLTVRVPHTGIDYPRTLDSRCSIEFYAVLQHLVRRVRISGVEGPGQRPTAGRPVRTGFRRPACHLSSAHQRKRTASESVVQDLVRPWFFLHRYLGIWKCTRASRGTKCCAVMERVTRPELRPADNAGLLFPVWFAPRPHKQEPAPWRDKQLAHNIWLVIS